MHHTPRITQRRYKLVTVLLATVLLGAVGSGIDPWWSMDDGSGQTVEDITGSLDAVRGYDDTSESSDPSWSTNCPSDSCLLFDGSNDRVTIPADDRLNYGTDYTLQAWFNTHNLNGDRRIYQRASSRYGMYQEGDTNRLIAYVDTRDDGGTWEAATWDIPQTYTWYHAVMTYDGSYIRLYVDGNLVDTQAQSGQTDSGESLKPAIGAHQQSNSYNQYWDGLLDEVRLYDKVLSQSEVEDNYNNPGDSTAPSTSITGPSTSETYSDDISVSTNDADSESGLDYCQYRTKDGSNSWSGWKSRTCNANFTVTVDKSGAECTTEGTDSCGVRIQAVDNAGNSNTDTEYFNIDHPDTTPPSTTDDYTDDEWKQTAQDITLTCTDEESGCAQIEWRILKNGNQVDSGIIGSSQGSVTVGDGNDGALYLEYRGWDNDGNTESWNTQRVRVDKEQPTTDITSPSESGWIGGDFDVDVDDSDGVSGVDGNRCAYQLKDGSSAWTAWQSRTCDGSFTVSVGQSGSGADCTTEGVDACSVRTRVYDVAGNVDTDWADFDIDMSAPRVSDDYTDDEWKDTVQDITLQCDDDGAGCSRIEWNVTQYGTEIDSGQEIGSSGTVTVGDNNNGELYLWYRGVDSDGKKTYWHRQRVRIDKESASTSIHGNTSKWYNDDFSVTIKDNASASGFDRMDLYYTVDGSASFYDEWNTLENNVHYIEREVEQNTSIDIHDVVTSTNNSYDGRAAHRRVCMNGQTLPDSFDPDPYCDRRYNILADVTNMEPYLDWINDRHGLSLTASTYDPYGIPGSGTSGTAEGESPLEGWGISMLDLINRNPWRSGTYRVIVNVGDFDTNGGTGGSGDNPSCGDSNSEALAQDLDQLATDQNIRVFSLLGGPECEDNPNDGIHSSYAERQMNITGDVLRYSQASQLPDKIIKELKTFKPRTCYYRVKDDDTWSDWQNRRCGTANITISVGPDDSNDCTTNGQNACVVQTRVVDGSGENHTSTAGFNIDYSGPVIGCDDCNMPEPVVLGRQVIFDPNVTDPHSGVSQGRVCAGEHCDDEFCSFTGQSTQCTYQAPYPYGDYDYCVQADDQPGNRHTLCHENLTVSILAGLGDPCNADNECILGQCIEDMCVGENVPPPGLKLY